MRRWYPDPSSEIKASTDYNPQEAEPVGFEVAFPAPAELKEPMVYQMEVESECAIISPIEFTAEGEVLFRTGSGDEAVRTGSGDEAEELPPPVVCEPAPSEGDYWVVFNRLQATRQLPWVIRRLLPLLNPRLMEGLAITAGIGALLALKFGASPAIIPIAVIVAALSAFVGLALRSSFRYVARQSHWSWRGQEA